MTHDTWVVACGGKEPVMEIHGKRYQYMWNQTTGDHAYYCFEDDIFHTDPDMYPPLPRCLTGNP